MKLQNMTTFYIVRHGQTQWNIEQKIQGQTDNPLTALGEQQATVLANELEDIAFECIYSSDLNRAHRTAQIIADKKKLPVRTTKSLRERNMGTFEGKEIHSENEYLLLSKWFTKVTNGKSKKIGVESDEEVMSRFLTFVDEKIKEENGKTILLVTHGSLIKAVLVHLGFAQHDQLIHGAIKNTAYLALQSDGNSFFIKDMKGISIQK